MLWFLLVGIISGWLANMISRGGDFGIWGDLMTGVIGSSIGRYLFNHYMGISANNIKESIIASAAGAIILLWVMWLFRVAIPAQKKE